MTVYLMIFLLQSLKPGVDKKGLSLINNYLSKLNKERKQILLIVADMT